MVHSLCFCGGGIGGVLVQDGRHVAIQQPDGGQQDWDLQVRGTAALSH